MTLGLLDSWILDSACIVALPCSEPGEEGQATPDDRPSVGQELKVGVGLRARARLAPASQGGVSGGPHAARQQRVRAFAASLVEGVSKLSEQIRSPSHENPTKLAALLRVTKAEVQPVAEPLSALQKGSIVVDKILCAGVSSHRRNA